MKFLQQKLHPKIVGKLYPKSKRTVLLIGCLFLILIVIGLAFAPDVAPLFNRHGVTALKSIKRNISDTTPVSHFKIPTKQDQRLINDKPIPSTGCNAPLSLARGKSLYMGISVRDTKRRFLLYLPAHYGNTTEHPLILAFHGYAGDSFRMEQFSRFDALANANNLIVVYPEGSTSLVKLRGWNTGLHPTITTNDVLFVSDLLNALQDNLCVNPLQIYATGFSNGGGFVAKLACQLSNRIATFAPISGSYVTAFKTCKATRPISIIEFHGSRDTIVPYKGLAAKKEIGALRWTSQWAERDKCSPKPEIHVESSKITQYIWNTCRDNASVVHYKIIGEGHAWPRVLFQQNVSDHTQQLNTANIIWDFFKQHPLQNTI